MVPSLSASGILGPLPLPLRRGGWLDEIAVPIAVLVHALVERFLQNVGQVTTGRNDAVGLTVLVVTTVALLLWMQERQVIFLVIVVATAPRLFPNGLAAAILTTVLSRTVMTVTIQTLVQNGLLALENSNGVVVVWWMVHTAERFAADHAAVMMMMLGSSGIGSRAAGGRRNDGDSGRRRQQQDPFFLRGAVVLGTKPQRV